MRHSIILFPLLMMPPTLAYADMEKIATPCKNSICFHWWPKLPNIKGWHQDRDQSLYFSVNAQAPDGKTFADAETVIYANAPYKPRIPETKSLQMLIDDDQKNFRSNYPGIDIQEVDSLVTSDGQVLRSFRYFPEKKGNWEQVSYGEEGDFYLIFTISSRSKKGFDNAFNDYKQFVNGYAQDSFGRRVRDAKLIESSLAGAEYQKTFWKQVGSYAATVMQKCFKKGTQPDVKFFTLVADVLPNSSLDHIEVRPDTKMSQCFVEGFSRGSFPQPPGIFGEKGMPIEIDMTITP